MIDTKIFFKTGILAFTVIGVCNLANFFIFYNEGNFFSHVASGFSILFNFVTAGFFYYLLKTQTSTLSAENDIKDIEAALSEFNSTAGVTSKSFTPGSTKRGKA